MHVTHERSQSERLHTVWFEFSDSWAKPKLWRQSEKAMAPHSSTLAWRIPQMEEPGRLQPMESEESDVTEQLHFHFSLSCIGEGNGNPLQCSCLENPREGGAQWAAVYGVTQSRTRLTQLSSSSSSMETIKESVVSRNQKRRRDKQAEHIEFLE